MATSEVDTMAASLQHAELTAADAESSDLEYAYSLQLQEAIAASQCHPSSTSHQIPPPISLPATTSMDDSGSSGGGDMKLFLEMQQLELIKYQQEVADRQQALAEMRRFSNEVFRRNHDANFARAIDDMDEEEWGDVGDEYEKPFDSTVVEKDRRAFKLYFKGLISCEYVGVEGVEDSWDSFAGAGIAIYDPDDELVLEVRKPLEKDLCKAAAEYMALKEGLVTALSLGINNINAYGDSVQVHNQLTGTWSVRQRKILNYVHEVENQLGKLDKVFMVLLPRCDNRLAVTLAREAIDSQLIRRAEYHHQRKQSNKENCSICLEDYDASQMYVVMNCHHRYCVHCMAQHAEVKLRHGCLPACPYEGCTTKLTVDGCKNFLSSKLIEIFVKRLEEAAIPESDKVYCPYSDCSELMTKAAIHRLPHASSSSYPPMRRECLKCHRFFCIECRVPWHATMSCQDYERQAPKLYGSDAKLHLLAKDNRWRRCTKCKHMIELAEGCNHMTCRCGFEFCYVCGAEWKNKKQTCNCLLWEEHNIIQEPLADDDDSESDDEVYVDYPPRYRRYHVG